MYVSTISAPTAIRALMRHGPEIVSKYDLSSLRILGSVGYGVISLFCLVLFVDLFF